MEAGQKIAERYLLEEQIGAGGMGVVWRAMDERLRRPVAIKRAGPLAPQGGQLDGNSPSSARSRHQLLREGLMGASLTHPNVVTVHDVLFDKDETLLVMEYVPSWSLARLIDERGSLPVEQIAYVGAQVADALRAVHARGVVHRDVKPGNVLITEDWKVKVTDFGISHAAWGDLTLTQTGLVSGTPGYLAPEVAQGDEPTPASDIFSLGATLYAAAEGRSPFGTAQDNPLKVIRRAADHQVEPPTNCGDLVPALSALMAKDPGDRPDAGGAQRLLNRHNSMARQDVAQPNPAWGAPTLDVEPVKVPRPRGASKLLVKSGFGAKHPVVSIATLTLLAILLPTGSTAGILAAQGQGKSPTKTTASPVSANKHTATLGDQRTVDPCALLSVDVMGRFGTAKLAKEMGNFDRCDITINGDSSKDGVDVQLDFSALTTAPGPNTGKLRKVGQLQIIELAKESDSCQRKIFLPDKTIVILQADIQAAKGPDLCKIVDAAVNHAAEILNRGPAPRRKESFPAGSLAFRDACMMVTSKDLERIPGVNAAAPNIGFGRWACTWSSTTDDLHAKINFDRNPPLQAGEDGQPTEVNGRTMFVDRDDDPDNCIVKIPYRDIIDSIGQSKVELVQIMVNHGEKERVCQLATDLGGAVAAKFKSA